MPAHPGLRVLAPADMVLHAMCHLFMNEEMTRALRDLSDLHLLLRHFDQNEAGFWPRLLSRAPELDLCRPLFYGLRYTSSLLGTPVPAETLRQTERWAPAWTAPMDALWHRAFRSPHPSATLKGHALALFALYIRGHWLRMPPAMLARHLSVKALGLHKDRPSEGAADKGG